MPLESYRCYSRIVRGQGPADLVPSVTLHYPCVSWRVLDVDYCTGARVPVELIGVEESIRDEYAYPPITGYVSDYGVHTYRRASYASLQGLIDHRRSQGVELYRGSERQTRLQLTPELVALLVHLARLRSEGQMRFPIYLGHDVHSVPVIVASAAEWAEVYGAYVEDLAWLHTSTRPRSVLWLAKVIREAETKADLDDIEWEAMQ
jgi:hypothetical protein